MFGLELIFVEFLGWLVFGGSWGFLRGVDFLVWGVFLVVVVVVYFVLILQQDHLQTEGSRW